MRKRLLRSKTDRMLAGICGGLGQYLGADSTVIRLLWVIGTVLTGIFPGVLIYFAAWFIVPEEDF